MRHINIAMEKMNNSTEVKSEEHISIVERILQKTNNPKIAAVLALDLIMVGVDTVSLGYKLFSFSMFCLHCYKYCNFFF